MYHQINYTAASKGHVRGELAGGVAEARAHLAPLKGLPGEAGAIQAVVASLSLDEMQKST